MKIFSRATIFFLVMLAIFLATDIVTKVFFFSTLESGIIYPIIPSIIDFVLLKNFGIAFSWFADTGENARWILVGVMSTLTLVAIIIWWVYGRKHAFANFAFALFIAGAIGNLYDRIVYGYVRDFIAFAFMDFAVFNVADICLCLGTALLAMTLILNAFKPERPAKKVQRLWSEVEKC